MTRNRLYGTFLTGTALLVSVFSSALMDAQVSPAARRITAAVNEADRVTLSGSIRKNISRAADLGPVSTSMMAHHVILILQRNADRQAALDQYLSDVQNRQSAQYHQWVTPAEYGARFGASADDVQALSAWIQSHGMTIEKASPAANMISFSGTVGQLQTAFSTSIHSVSMNGEKHLANISAPQVPRALAPAVKGVLGLDDFHPHANVQQGPTAKYNAATHHIDPDFTLFDTSGNPYLYVDPADAATIYDTPNAALNPSYKGTTFDGTGVTIGIVGDSNVDMVPVTNYRLAFLGETASTVNLPTVIIDGTDPGINGDEVETFLDMEVLGGLAPKAKINYYASADSDLSAGLFNALERAINDNTVSILSSSFGECEAGVGASTNQFISEIYQQAAAQGITITVSSGDSGAAGCDSSGSESATGGLAVNGLGSTPYNIAVGGTDYVALASGFSTYADAVDSGQPPYYRTALSYIPEEPWNDSTSANGALADNSPLLNAGATNVIAAGGGKSSVYTKPAFQSALTPADGARDLPDVSFLAANGLYGAVWVLCESDALYGPNCATENGAFVSGARFSGAGGTSAATPAFAGMLALVEQSTGSRLGQANNVLYQLAANKYSTVFHDVATGNNAVVCTAGSADCGANGFTNGYDAVSGYDLASGLGSVDAAAMVANWSTALGASSGTTLTIDGSATPVSVVHGTSLNFAVGVNPTTATGSAGLVTTEQAAAGVPTLNGQSFTIPIANGAGTGSYNGLPGGQYTVYATYSGDASTAASQSTPLSVNIAAEASSTQLTVNAYNQMEVPITTVNALPYGSYLFAETSVYGTAEGYNASLGYATGTMTILDNGTQVGTSPITSGNYASFPAIVTGAYPYAVGAHKLTATYPGDLSYKSNTSNAVNFTVVKAATLSSVFPKTATLFSTASDAVEVDVTSSSLGTSPTGTLTLTANGTTLGTSSNLITSTALDGTALSYAIFNVQGSQLQNGVNTLTATYTGDTNYVGSTGTGTIAETQASFALTAGAINITAGATTGNTAILSASTTGGFAGLVNLSCTVTTAPAGATSPVTCSVPATINITGTSAASTTLTAGSTASTTGGAYVVTITGADAATGKITASTTSQVMVTAAPGVALTNSAAIAIAAGATTGNTSTLTLTPSGGFTGVIGLACAVTTAPAGAVDPVTCGVTPTSVTISGTAAGTATLSIASTAATTAELHKSQDLFRGVGGSFLALTVFLFLPSRRRRQFAGLAALLVLVSLGALTGCGGGGKASGGGTTTVPGTTAGSYVVTVTATPAGEAVQSTTVSITVN